LRCEFVDEWKESLIWVPSQLYRRARCGPYLFTLYLRWRHEDPWEFYVALGDMSGDRWEFVTGDLFRERGAFFRDEEYREAERAAEEIFLQSVDRILDSVYRGIRRALEAVS